MLVTSLIIKIKCNTYFLINKLKLKITINMYIIHIHITLILVQCIYLVII